MAAEPHDKHVEPYVRNTVNEQTSGANAQPPVRTERTGSFNSGGDNYDTRTHQAPNRVSRPHSCGPQGSSRSSSVNHQDVSSDPSAGRSGSDKGTCYSTS